MNKIPVSVLIVTKNAGGSLKECLDALEDFNEVIVIDSASTDDTIQIAQHAGTNVINFQWNGEYPKKRQWCLETLSLKNDWVLFVDADEILTESLKEEIRELFSTNPEEAGFFVTGQYVWNGQLLSHGQHNKKIALLHRRRMGFPEVNDLGCPDMGEIEGHYQPILKDTGKIGRLKNSLLHHANHAPEEWEERHERYAAWERCMNKKRAWPDDPIPWRNLFKKILRSNPLRPELMFLYSYIFKQGFRDGVIGYDFAKSRWKYYRMIRNSGQKPTSIE